MNFLEQQSKLSRILGDPNSSTEDLWPLADRKFEINRGEIRFAEKSKSLLGYATGTVSGQAITLPDGFLEVHEMEINGENLTARGEMALHDSAHYASSGESNYYFWVDADGLRKIRFPDTVGNGVIYNFWYFKKPTVDLSADVDESPFQDEWREASVFYAASELLPSAGKFTLAEYYRGRFNEMAEAARVKTESMYLSSIRAYPYVEDQYQYDRDIQGHKNSGIE